METIILNKMIEAVKISCKNENTPIENIDTLNIHPKKKKKANKGNLKNKKPKKKYTGLKDLLDDISKNKNKTITINQKNNLNEKNDISEIKISEKLEIGSKTRDVSELDFKEFEDLNISSKTEVDSSSQNNYPEKIISIENEQNIDNDKIKTNFSICDYYNGYDRFLSGSETSIINLSNSLNFIKKEKLRENFSEENNNSNINVKEDFVNSNSRNNKNDNFVNIGLQDNSNINQNNDINNSLQNINKIKRNINKDLENISNNFYDCNFEFPDNSKYLKNNAYKKEKELEPNYSKFDFYNNDYNVTCKFNFTGNHKGRRRLWICKYCGNDNYHFRDFCHVCNNPKFWSYGNK